jgi:hypothetical protein
MNTYPLLSHLEMGVASAETSAIPEIIFDIDSWFQANSVGTAAFIIPSVYETALHVSLSMSLSLARRGFERRVSDHLHNGFKRGQRVSVLPTRQVYEYDGFLELSEDYGTKDVQRLLWLQLIDDKGHGRISFPESEIARLERTDKTWPLGRSGIQLGSFITTDLDKFLDTRSGGNKEFFETDVFVVTSPSKFERFVSNATLKRTDKLHLGDIECSRMLPWGKLKNDGDVVLASSKAGKGRPLIAVSAGLDPVMRYLQRNPNSKPRVIIDGAASAIGNPTVFADISNLTSVAIIAGFKDVPAIRNLGGQTQLNAFQVPPERLDSPNSTDRSVFYSCSKAAQNAVAFEAIEIEEVKSEEFDGASDALNDAVTSLHEVEIPTEQEEFLKRLFRHLLRSSNDTGNTPDPIATTEFLQLETEFNAKRRFWPPEIAQSIDTAIKNLGKGQDKCAGPDSVKRTYVKSLLERDLTESDEAKLKNREILLNDGEVDYILLTGWPGKHKLQDIVYRFQTTRIKAIAFGFEAEWFRSFNRRYRDTELYSATRDLPYRPSENPKIVDLGRLSSGDVRLSDEPNNSIEDLLSKKRTTRPVFDSGSEANNVDATVVEFSDGRYTYLTSDQKVPVLISFGQFEGEVDAQIKSLSVVDLEPGQLCIFRDGANGDAVRLFAEIRIGESQYEQLRKIATAWKSPLRLLDTHKAVTMGDKTYVPPNVSGIIQRIRDAGFSGSSQTIRNWIKNPNMIGPGDRTSVELIASLSADDFLNGNIDKVWSAIQFLRTLHMQAGNDLTAALLEELPEKIMESSQSTGTFSLTFGDLVVVEVSEVETTAFPVPAELTNRLVGESSD